MSINRTGKQSIDFGETTPIFRTKTDDSERESLVVSLYKPFNEEMISNENMVVLILKNCKTIFHISWPIFITAQFQSLIYTVLLLYIGHYLSSDILSGVGLGCTVCAITSQSIIVGMTAGLDTLCGNAHGAGLNYRIGIYLQRSVFISHIVLLFVIPVLYNTTTLLKLFVDLSDAVLNYTQNYITIFIIALWPLSIWFNLRRYLQSQKQTKIIFYSVIFLLFGQLLWIGIFNYGLNNKSNYIYTAYSIPIAYWFQFISLVFIVLYQGKYKRNWDGIKWSQTFKKLNQLLRLSIPATLMLASEWIAFEIQTIFASMIDANQLAACSLMFNYLQYVAKIPLSLSWGINIIVSNNLGKGNIHKAKLGWDSGLFLCIIITSIVCSLTYLFRDHIAMMYISQNGNNHDDIKDIFKNLLIIVSGYMMIDQIQRCGQGALNGIGRQKIGAMINIVSYYIIGIPSGLILCFYVKWNVYGLWIGMVIASLFSSLIFIYLRLNINWENELIRARKRVQSSQG